MAPTAVRHVARPFTRPISGDWDVSVRQRGVARGVGWLEEASVRRNERDMMRGLLERPRLNGCIQHECGNARPSAARRARADGSPKRSISESVAHGRREGDATSPRAPVVRRSRPPPDFGKRLSAEPTVAIALLPSARPATRRGAHSGVDATRTGSTVRPHGVRSNFSAPGGPAPQASSAPSSRWGGVKRLPSR